MESSGQEPVTMAATQSFVPETLRQNTYGYAPPSSSYEYRRHSTPYERPQSPYHGCSSFDGHQSPNRGRSSFGRSSPPRRISGAERERFNFTPPGESIPTSRQAEETIRMVPRLPVTPTMARHFATRRSVFPFQLEPNTARARSYVSPYQLEPTTAAHMQPNAAPAAPRWIRDAYFDRFEIGRERETWNSPRDRREAPGVYHREPLPMIYHDPYHGEIEVGRPSSPVYPSRGAASLYHDSRPYNAPYRGPRDDEIEVRRNWAPRRAGEEADSYYHEHEPMAGHERHRGIHGQADAEKPGPIISSRYGRSNESMPVHERYHRNTSASNSAPNLHHHYHSPLPIRAPYFHHRNSPHLRTSLQPSYSFSFSICAERRAAGGLSGVGMRGYSTRGEAGGDKTGQGKTAGEWREREKRYWQEGLWKRGGRVPDLRTRGKERTGKRKRMRKKNTKAGKPRPL